MADAKKKGLNIRLTAADGSTMKLQLKIAKGTGAISTCVVHSTPKDAAGKRTNARGASATHATREKGEEAVNAILASALRLGWTKVVSNGFVARPDAFTASSLPKPGTAPTTTTAKK